MAAVEMEACWEGTLQALVVVGASHRSSSLATRERLFIEEAAVPEILATLRAAGFEQALVLSTCDRTEVAAIDGTPDGNPDAARQRITAVLAQHAGLPAADITPEFYIFVGEQAVRHIFRVTASLDSLVIGEPHVQGQVKASHRAAQRAAMTGSELEAVFQAAYAVAKRVRSETGVTRRAVSLASAAAETARRLHGELNRCSGLLLGTGEIGELIAEILRAKGLGHLVVIHPQAARAEAVARHLGCHVSSYESLAQCLVNADIVVTALGARQVVLSPETMRTTLFQRRQRPVFVVDAALPGDVDPAVDRLDGIFRYTLGDLERIAMEGRAYRKTEFHAAMRIVDEAVGLFVRDRAARAAGPVLAALHGHFEAVRERALRDAGGDAEKATQLLINRLLHRPSAILRALAIRQGARQSEFRAAQRALQRLFGLAGEDDAEDGAAEDKE
jgi:glutamyl-tRNA reductase